MQAGSKWGTKFMLNNNEHFILTDLADGLPDEELSAEALAMNTTEAAEVEIARRVRSLMVELRAASIEVPGHPTEPTPSNPKAVGLESSLDRRRCPMSY